jgi:putative ABC transport system permease protein
MIRVSAVTVLVLAISAAAALLAAAGPFAETVIGRPGTPVTARLGGPGGTPLESMTLTGRASPGGPVDDVTLVAGHWARQAGQIVLRFGYQGGHVPVGSGLTLTGLPGAPRLEVVGLAVSISGSADAWVIPAEVARLRRPGTPATAQMLYRFGGAATSQAIGADVAAVRAALPAGALTGARSYLTGKAADTARVEAYLPVLVACGLAGLVLALVAAARTGLGLVPAAAGCLAGVLLGNLLARPLLAGAAYAFGPGVLGVPAWVDTDVAVVMFGLTVLAALAPARWLTRVP